MQLIYVLIVFFLVASEAKKDACKSDGHINIPNMGFRYINYRIDITVSPYHDYNLPDGWYFVGNEPMPEHPPDQIYTCGTKFPVWLNGTHPKDDTEVTLTACQKTVVKECDIQYSIQVQNCGTFYVYFLKRTKSSNAGYCFGEGINGNATTYVSPKPQIRSNLTITQYGAYSVTSAYLACEFIESKPDQLFYVVSWYMNNNVLYRSTYDTTSASLAFRLTEDIFKGHGFKMGNDISCSVRAFRERNSVPGTLSDISDSFFVGIKVLTPNIALNNTRNSTQPIRIQPTMPIGCQDSPCYLRLVAYVPDDSVHGKCNGLAFKESSCGVKLHSQSYSEEKKILVQTIENGQYPSAIKISTYEIFLKVLEAGENKIWGDYTLPPIKVNVIDTSTSTTYEGKRCHSINDPHIKTFDGRVYDNHQDGEYVLYKNTKYNTEIQSKYYTCGHRSGASNPIRCNCGIAVRAGRDLYEINLCNNKKVSIGYKLCSDKMLQVESKGESKYKVIFSYGTYVEVSLLQQRHTFSVYIIPSSHDVDFTVGLCGTLDGDMTNDFRRRTAVDGKFNYITKYNPPHTQFGDANTEYNSQPVDFLEEWRVNEKESLFSDDVDSSLFSPWAFKSCVCTESINKDHSTRRDVENYIPCSPNAVSTCTQGKVVGVHSCSSGANRRRRSLERSYIIPEVYIAPGRIHKRDVQAVPMTEDEAKVYCQKQIGGSSVFSLCSNVPSAHANSSLGVCVADILLSGTTDWTDGTKESMQDACLSELRRNTTLRDTSGNKTSIAQEIEAKACPNNCSQVGICNKGQCDCDDGFGGSDCSINLKIGPTISGLLDHGLCDEKDIACDHAYVFGNVFIDSVNLTCKLEGFTMFENGTRQTNTIHYVNAEFETFIETMCPLSAPRSKRSVSGPANDVFVSGFKISVSNDGRIYEDGKDLFIYDSTCQLIQNISNSIRFKLMDGFCFIDNVCVSDGTINAADRCLKCDDDADTRSWTNVETADCQTLKPVTHHPRDVSKEKVDNDSEGSNYLWVIGVVAGVLVGVAIGTVVVIKLTKKRGKRVSDSSLSLGQTPPQPTANK